MSEHDIQRAIAEYIRVRYPKVIFTATLGGLRLTIGMAMKIKRAGYQPGIPDLIILEPRGQYHGMCIEVKKPGGRTSLCQDQALLALHSKGYMAMVVWSVAQAVEMIDEYMSSRNLTQAER